MKIWLIIFITVSLLFSQDLITGTTASGTSLVDIPVWQLKLSDIIGLNTLKCKYVTLNGLKNTLSIDIVGIATEFDLNSAGGSLTADLQLVKLIVAAEGDENSRHFVGIEGTIGSYELRLELDFKPGMSSVTTAIVKENIEPTPYKLVITNLSTDQTLVFESKEIPNNQDVTAGLPVTFNQAIPPRVKLLETVTISFKVDQSRVSAYRFKLDVPGDWTGGIKYAIFKWSDWTNDTGQSISYSAFEKEGTYKFTVEFRDKSSGRTRKIVKEFQVYWEYPEIRFEAIDIDFHYIRRAPDEKEKYRRAAEEYKKAYDMWMRKFEYEYKMLRLTGNTAEELVQAVSAGIVKKSAHVALANVNAPPVFGHLLSGLTLYSIIKEGYITLATVYRNIEANKAASMAIVTHALYRIYWGKYNSYISFDFYNTSYDYDFGYRIKTYKFKNGKWSYDDDINSETVSLMEVIKTNYFNLNTQEYTLIFYTSSGNRGDYTILTGEIKSNRFSCQYTLSSVAEPDITTSRILTSNPVYLPSDAMCCPSFLEISEYEPDTVLNQWKLVSNKRIRKHY